MVVTLAEGLVTTPYTKITVTGASIVVAIAVSGIVYWLHQKKKNSDYKIPTEWKPIGQVQSLYIYPLKSGKANEMKQGECTPLGIRETRDLSSTDTVKQDKLLLQDRCFMIYHQDSQKFLTARQKNKLLLITIRSSGPNEVTLSAPNSEEQVNFKISESNERRVKCSMHSGEEVYVMDCGDEVANWLSKTIFGKDSGLRLGYYSDLEERQRTFSKGPYKNYPIMKKYMNDSDFGALSDVASYMLLSQKSVDDLKSRLGPEEAANVKVTQFRPNIVVSGPDISAYDEDNWSWIKIGERVVLKGFKPCTRCLMVTLNPDKGEANPTKEPLITLKKYRQVTDKALKNVEGNSPVFGRYFGLHIAGCLSVGDTVYVPA